MIKQNSRFAVAFLPLSAVTILTASSSFAQQPGETSKGPTILRVQVDAPSKVKAGARVTARTVDPLYVGNELALPARTQVVGAISRVQPVARDKRIDAISHGDFTPLKDATIQFDHVVLANGASMPITAEPSAQSADVFRFQSSAGRPHQSLLRKAWSDASARKNQAIEQVTAPGKADRLKKLLFSQLPWHPQAIESGAQYDVILRQPIAPTPSGILAGTQKSSGNPEGTLQKTAPVLHARLQKDLTSRSAHRDDPVLATVTQPVLDAQGKIEVPQGATLHGRVLQAQPAKKWGRNGALRFTFSQVDFPNEAQAGVVVAGVPTAVDGSKNGSLKLDAEGGVQPDTNKGLLLPLTLGWLAASSILDTDGGIGRIAVTSNGFGLITRVIAITTGSRLVGAAIGSAATARTIYTRFLAHGRDVNFARNSQIEVELGPVHKLPQSATP